jgi:hypothetical protein
VGIHESSGGPSRLDPNRSALNGSHVGLSGLGESCLQRVAGGSTNLWGGRASHSGRIALSEPCSSEKDSSRKTKFHRWQIRYRSHIDKVKRIHGSATQTHQQLFLRLLGFRQILRSTNEFSKMSLTKTARPSAGLSNVT